MKRYFSITVLLIISLKLNAQVGIGTTTPNSTSILDISATDKGVLVPRINLVDVTNLTTPINTPAIGLLIWNTNASVTGGNGIGFYFSNGSQWMPIQQSQIEDVDFHEEGTTNAPNDINDDIYTLGNMAIGQTTANYNLDVFENTNPVTINLNNTTTSGTISGIYNRVGGNMTTIGTQRGIYNVLNGNNSGIKTGTHNEISTAGFIRNGTYNSITTDSDSSDYGIYNSITSSSITGNYGKIGTYNSINNGGTSDNYGVYNILNGSSSRPQTGTFNWIINSSNTNSSSSFAIRNIMQMSGSGTQYGVHNEFSSANGSGFKIGVRNAMNSANDASRFGVVNYFDGTGNGNHTGISNTIRGTGTGYKYGTNTFIPATAGGTHFGIYSTVLKPGSFSGFFIGNVAIGTQPYGTASPDHYILPSSRGLNNQIMQIDGSGNVNWADIPLSSFWSRSGGNLDVATAADDINFTSDQTSITFPQTTGTPSSMIYLFNGGSNNSDRMIFSHSTTYSGWGLQYRDSDDSFRFLGGGTDRVTINLATGNPLVVNGNAQATNFISSTTTYPDYVFEKYFNGTSTIRGDYKFRALKDVEIFIKTHHHLPGVKSYKDIKAKDMTINLSDVSITNLEKIEELFIYAIELQKENEKLKENQNVLDKRLEKIEAILNINN